VIVELGTNKDKMLWGRDGEGVVKICDKEQWRTEGVGVRNPPIDVANFLLCQKCVKIQYLQCPSPDPSPVGRGCSSTTPRRLRRLDPSHAEILGTPLIREWRRVLILITTTSLL